MVWLKRKKQRIITHKYTLIPIIIILSHAIFKFNKHTWWVYDWCLCAAENVAPWTQYFHRTTQPILVILDKMPSVSTLSIEALSLVHCTWWSSASRHPLTIWYPAWGCLDLMTLISVSRASSVMEYRLWHIVLLHPPVDSSSWESKNVCYTCGR